MILLSLPSVIGLLLILPMAFLAFLWLRDNQSREDRKTIPTTLVMVECDICLHRFTCHKDDAFVRCPRCNNLMERGNKKARR